MKHLGRGWTEASRVFWVVVDPRGAAYLSSASTLSRGRAIRRFVADSGPHPWRRWYRWGYRTTRVHIASKPAPVLRHVR